MTVFLAALAVTVGLYSALVLAMAVRAVRAPGGIAPAAEPLPRVGVLVAARNEEDRLGRCLDALLAQDYPADRLTIYVADDHSTDRTAAVIRRYARRGADALVLASATPEAWEGDAPSSPAVRYVAVPDPVGTLAGKANAIHAAVGASDEALLLVTDADCAPPPGWVRHHAAYFGDPVVGLVCGHAEVEHRTSFEAAQALDWSFLLAVCTVLAEAGRPVTAMGNNMAFRRAAYEAVGGYPALPFSVTEDYVLFRTIAARSGFRVRVLFDAGLRVRTLPLDRWADVHQQRRRWARGGGAAVGLRRLRPGSPRPPPPARRAHRGAGGGARRPRPQGRRRRGPVVGRAPVRRPAPAPPRVPALRGLPLRLRDDAARRRHALPPHPLESAGAVGR